MFWGDAAHYQHVPVSEKQLLEQQRASYQQNGFHKHVPFLPGGAGTANLIPKHKDDSRMRPITDTTKVPARGMSRAVAAVLMLLLSHFWSWASFNITATKDLAGRVAQFCSEFGEFGDVDIFSFDVKNMYTELRHQDVDNALYQFLQLVRSRLHTLSFHVHKSRKRKNAFVGVNPGSSLFYSMPFRILHKYVLWELDNNFFWAGNVLLKQSIGISMGGSCSPVLAQILCTWCEYTWLSSLGADARFIRGVRFMDDSTLFVVRGHSHLAVAYQQHCFPAGCVLEGDTVGVSSVNMLESQVSVLSRNRLACVHVNKNQVSLFSHHKQHIMRYVHAHSGTAVSTKFHTACGVLCRMFYNTTSQHVGMLWGPMLTFVCELVHLQYSFSFILAVLRSTLSRCHRLPIASQWVPMARLVIKCVMTVVCWFRSFTCALEAGPLHM